MERSTIFHGKIHYFYGDLKNSYVKLPEGRFDDFIDGIDGWYKWLTNHDFFHGLF